MASTGDRARRAIAEKLGRSIHDINNEDKLWEKFDLLPVDFIRLLEGLEDEFKLNIPEEYLDKVIKFKTVGDFVKLVEDLQKKKKK